MKSLQLWWQFNFYVQIEEFLQFLCIPIFVLRYKMSQNYVIPVLWPPDMKNWLIGKDPDAGKYWRQEEKRATENEMVGGHCWLNGHEFEQALGVGDAQGSLACLGSQRVRYDWMTELNWINYSETRKLKI